LRIVLWSVIELIELTVCTNLSRKLRCQWGLGHVNLLRSGKPPSTSRSVSRAWTCSVLSGSKPWEALLQVGPEMKRRRKLSSMVPSPGGHSAQKCRHSFLRYFLEVWKVYNYFLTSLNFFVQIYRIIIKYRGRRIAYRMKMLWKSGKVLKFFYCSLSWILL